MNRVIKQRDLNALCVTGPGHGIHEGGELGYSLVHAYGAAFDNLTGADLDDARLATAIAGTTVFARLSTPRTFPGRPHRRRHRCLRRRITYFSTAARPPGRSSSSR